MAEAFISSGLARILSNEPLPRTPMFRHDDPVRIASEMEEYVRNLHIYLQRLSGLFTAENIISTIQTGGGGTSGVFEKVWNIERKYVGTNTLTVTIDDSRDWRAYDFIVFARMAKTITELIEETVPSDGVDASFVGTPQWSTFDIINVAVDGLNLDLLCDATDGHLDLTLTNGAGTSKTRYIHLWIGAMIKTSDAEASYSSLGNGL